MRIAHKGCDIPYLLEAATYKGALEMRFRKIVSTDDTRLKEPYYYPPEEEFTETEQNDLQAYFVGFLQGNFEIMQAIPLEPFVFQIQAAAVVFGYTKGKCFEEWFASSEEADEAFERYREQVKLERQAQEEPDQPLFVT